MAVTIKNVRWIVYFGLIFSLVLTSHFSILELVVHCSDHHSEFSHTASAASAEKEACPGQHKCHHVSATYVFPPSIAELNIQFDTNLPLASHMRRPPQPFLDTPFQPPRHS